MKGKDFEKLLKNSAETPRSLSPSKGGWEQVNKQLPSKIPVWQSWLKFLPFTIGVVGLFVWNMQLQYQVNSLQEELKITKREVITIEQNINQQSISANQVAVEVGQNDIHKKALTSSIDQNYTSSSQSKNTRKYSKSVKSNLKNTRSIINKNTENRLSNSVNYNSNNLKTNVSLGAENQIDKSSLSKPLQKNEVGNEKDSLIFASKENIPTKPFKQENIVQTFDINQVLLENVALSDIEYAQILSIPKIEFDRTNLFKNESKKTSKLDSLTTRVASRLTNTKLKIGSTISGNVGLNGLTNYSYGANVQAAVRPDFLFVVGVEKGKSTQGILANPLIMPMVASDIYPEPEPDNIPVDGVLMDFGVNLEYTQIALGLKKMWYPDEHIRPFVELGWLPYKEKQGKVNYVYAIADPSSPFIFEVEDVIVEINQENSDFGWKLNTGYAAAGLSASFFKHKMELNASLRYTNALGSFTTLYHSNDKSTIGGQLGLAYNF